MAIKYYDDAIINKISKWFPADPSQNKIRVLNSDETARFFNLTAHDTSDGEFKLPLITLSRNKDIELINTNKQDRSFRGSAMVNDSTGIPDSSYRLNVIPISTSYQLDIYTKYEYEAEEYVRQLIFKLVNNPRIVIGIPYNGIDLYHTANLKVLSSVANTSDISNHLSADQFHRWTIQLELQDGFLFNIPYKKNWKFIEVDLENKDENNQWDPEQSWELDESTSCEDC